MWQSLGIIFAVSFGLSLALFVPARLLAFKLKIIDKPDARKIHDKPIPYLGSIMIFFGYMAGTAVYLYLYREHPHFKPNAVWGIGLSASAMYVLGILDDTFNIPAWWKLVLQVLIACIPLLFGIYIDKITNPLGGVMFLGMDTPLPSTIMLPLPVAYAITVFWLVALANAINLIDGMDGLASGISIISIVFICVNAFLVKSNVIFPMVALAGGLLGFLVFNFPPAKIFMGDSGALFIGFTIGVYSLVSNIKSSFAVTLLLPVVLLMIPIIDTVLAIVRRLKSKQHIFGADKRHLHHRLLDLGNSQKRVLIIMYLATAVLGVFSFVAFILPKEYTMILMFILIENIIFAIFILNLFEKRKDDMLRFQKHIENYSIVISEERQRYETLKEAKKAQESLLRKKREEARRAAEEIAKVKEAERQARREEERKKRESQKKKKRPRKKGSRG